MHTAELLMNEGQRFLFTAAAENTIVADADKTFGKDVQGEPSNELRGIQGHDFGFAFITIILVAKAHLAIREADDSMVGGCIARDIRPPVLARRRPAWRRPPMAF